MLPFFLKKDNHFVPVNNLLNVVICLTSIVTHVFYI